MSVERLEPRSMLSATVFPSLSGTAFYDVTQNGLTSDDLRLPGITVSLFRDGGNGQFGGDDQFLSSTITDSGGKYRFDNLSVGTYFVQQSAAPGYILPTGQDVAKVVVTASDTVGVTGQIVDSFSTTSQWVGASLRTGMTASSSMNATEALGGHRDLCVQLTSARGSISLGANADVPGMLDFASGSASNGMYWITWDGQGGDPQILNPTGLGQIDLTSQGASTGLKLILGADHDNGFVLVNVYSSAGNWSQATVAIPNTGDGTANEEVFVPFSSFVRRGGDGADFTRVGAMRMEINGVNAVDGQIGPIAAIGPKVFAQNFANVARTDLAIVKTHAPEPGTAGNQLTYTLTATNNGPSKATGVLVSDTLPAGLTYVSATSSQGTVSFSGGTLTVNLGNLSSGATATVTVVTTVGAGVTGTITNTGTITGNEPDPNLSNNTSTTVTNINASVDLAITKAATPNPVIAGNQLTYTLTTTNAGPSNATGVKIVDTLPAGVTYASASGQGTVSVSGGVITVTLGNMAVGATASTTIVVTVGAKTTGTLTNTAVVSGNESETNLANNTATVTTRVDVPVIPVGDPEIDLRIVKTGTPEPITLGSNLTYVLTVTNLATANNPDGSTATGVLVTDALPAGVTLVSATSSQGTVTTAGRTIRASLGTLLSQRTATVTVVVRVTSAPTGSVLNTATVDGNEDDPVPSNNTSSWTTRVLAPAPSKRWFLASNQGMWG